MPSSTSSRSTAPKPLSPAAPFRFPNDRHLILTTESKVLSWADDGLYERLRSGTENILAAKEAKDGSGVLAVADGSIVAIHDAAQRPASSAQDHKKKTDGTGTWRLKDTDGPVGILRFSPKDANHLYFTSALANSVQCYDTRCDILLPCGAQHPSPPTVVALSPTGHLLLSASEAPSTVYLQNVALNTKPILVQPSISSEKVVRAAFHPERPNIFLLAFASGTLAAYDGTRILPALSKTTSLDAAATAGLRASSANDAEIGRLEKLHAVTAQDYGWQGVVGHKSSGITGAEFLPGYGAHKLRAVSVGADGRCRIVDFAGGGKVLRTWHARGPVMCLSVLALQGASQKNVIVGKAGGGQMDGEGEIRRSRQVSALAKGSAHEASLANNRAINNNIITIGRQDGKVLMYDSLGLLLCEEKVDQQSGPVLDIEWMAGPGLKPAEGDGKIQFPSDHTLGIEISSGQETRKRRRASKGTMRLDIRTEPARPVEPQLGIEALDWDTGPQQRRVPSVQAATTADWEYLDPPEEQDHAMHEREESGTVSHMPITGPVHRALPPVSPIQAGKYMDLFSPVKEQHDNTSSLPSPKRRPTNAKPRARPRISSSTFLDSSPKSPQGESSTARRTGFSQNPVHPSPANPVEDDVVRRVYVDAELLQKSMSTVKMRPVVLPPPRREFTQRVSPTMSSSKRSSMKSPKLPKPRQVSDLLQQMPGAYISSNNNISSASSNKQSSSPSPKTSSSSSVIVTATYANSGPVRLGQVKENCPHIGSGNWSSDVLADLRRIGAGSRQSDSSRSGILAPYGAPKGKRRVSSGKARRVSGRANPLIAESGQSAKALSRQRAGSTVKAPSSIPKPLDSDEPEDIWLTSGAEDVPAAPRRNPRRVRAERLSASMRAPSGSQSTCKSECTSYISVPGSFPPEPPLTGYPANDHVDQLEREFLAQYDSQPSHSSSSQYDRNASGSEHTIILDNHSMSGALPTSSSGASDSPPHPQRRAPSIPKPSNPAATRSGTSPLKPKRNPPPIPSASSHAPSSPSAPPLTYQSGYTIPSNSSTHTRTPSPSRNPFFNSRKQSAVDLEPGTAASPKGPLRVEVYFPRSSSLAVLNGGSLGWRIEQRGKGKEGRGGARSVPQQIGRIGEMSGFDGEDLAPKKVGGELEVTTSDSAYSSAPSPHYSTVTRDGRERRVLGELDSNGSPKRVKAKGREWTTTEGEDGYELAVSGTGRDGRTEDGGGLKPAAGPQQFDGRKVKGTVGCACRGVCCGRLRGEIAQLRSEVETLRSRLALRAGGE